ncbi:MAG TPA: hypothetical protein PKZ44_09030 [Flavobacterium sp.]|nr:hypothetical protein [Flavobacterium sp.]
MDKNFKKLMWLFMLVILPLATYAQKDVTQFLDIPVDGYKADMIKKLKSKGFTINKYSGDALDGEFNGTDVNIFIATDNNKVWRIGVFDVNRTNETNIKIRFNNLIQQFVNNKRYFAQPDSTIAKYNIPKEEDISYEISVNKKRYEAVFYQKTVKYDSLIKEQEDLIRSKETLNNKDKDRVVDLIFEISKESMDSLNKQVWFMIQEDNGEYRIMIYYDNIYNKANGEGL